MLFSILLPSLEAVAEKSESKLKAAEKVASKKSTFHEKRLPDGLGFLDGVVGSALKPDLAYSLVELAPGVVARAEAFVLDFNKIISLNESAVGQHKWIVAAPFYPHEEKKDYRYSIFLREKEGAFAGTPVVTCQKESLKGSSRSISQLQESVSKERGELNQLIVKIEERHSKLQALRKTVEETTELENLIVLEEQLGYYDREKTKLLEERNRLRRLVSLGRSQVADESLPAVRRNLQEQLREAAKVTANADRLSERKKRAAVGRVRSQMALIRSTTGVDKKPLLRKLRKLRAQRKAIEKKAGLRLEASEEF